MLARSKASQKKATKASQQINTSTKYNANA
jgi:hypothetical protein